MMTMVLTTSKHFLGWVHMPALQKATTQTQSSNQAGWIELMWFHSNAWEVSGNITTRASGVVQNSYLINWHHSLSDPKRQQTRKLRNIKKWYHQ
jgi:hypothetical protein